MITAPFPHGEKLDPRKRRTRKSLEDALRELLKERSYKDIYVGDITEKALVNRATFYAHYLDKQDLASKMVRGDLEEALARRLPECRPLSVESLTEVGIGIFEFIGSLTGPCPIMADEFGTTVNRTIQQTIQSILRGWLEHDPHSMDGFGDASRDTVSAVLAWGLFGSALQWTCQSPRKDIESATAEVVKLLMPA